MLQNFFISFFNLLVFSLPGLLCHLEDACVSNPCHKDAMCDTNPVNGRAICTCPPGFTGGACDQDVDECSIGMYLFASPSNCKECCGVQRLTMDGG